MCRVSFNYFKKKRACDYLRGAKAERGPETQETPRV